MHNQDARLSHGSRALGDKMGNAIAVTLLTTLIKALNDKNLQDAILDLIEDWYQGTENKADDKIIGPLVQAYREVRDIPDND